MPSYVILLLGLVRSLVSTSAHHTPLETMADVTNDFGVCVLQVLWSPSANTVFSPYGLVSMALLVYEGSTGPGAAEIYNTLHLPWHRDIVRIGFRDLHRYLRSYFSSEGFLKGLVLSKPNVPLQPSYVEVLKFYGFQLDTSVTQPSVITTTLPSIGSESTTNFQETTTYLDTTLKTEALPTATESLATPPVTTASSTVEEANITTPGKNSVTTMPSIPTTRVALEDTTENIDVTNPTAANPETLSMLGSEDETKTSDLPNNIISQSAINSLKSDEKQRTTTIESSEPHNKTLEVLSSIGSKSSTLISNTPIINVNSISQELETTTDLTFVTILNNIVPALEKTNMVVNITNITRDIESTNITRDIEIKNNTTFNILSRDDSENESTIPNEYVTVPEMLSYVTNEITSNELLTEQDGSTFSSVLVDTTVPVEEFVILTSPPGIETVAEKSVSKLEALILTEEENTKSSEDATDNNIKKRSIRGEKELTSFSNKLYFNTANDAQYYNKYKNLLSAKAQVMLNSLYDNEFVTDNNNTEYPSGSAGSQENTDSGHRDNVFVISSDIHGIGATTPDDPGRESNTIMFTTVPDGRPPRAVKADTSGSSPLGNWVGGWRPGPGATAQWFWTYSGERHVPVLTYTAYLPYADLPDLQATALQLPLDEPRYTLMVLLPKSLRGLQQVLGALQWRSLRSLLRAFKPTPVYAAVPTFTIAQHVNLTPALTQLGIRSVFDESQANLSALTTEPRVHVRSLEQRITVSVHKYYTADKWFNASPTQVEQHFLATHPFAYFVIDVETKVALVAGTIVDPLLRNS